MASLRSMFAIPYRIRRFWMFAIGIVCLGVLIGSLVGDVLYGSNTTANVYTPVTLLLGGAFLSYIWSRREDKKIDNPTSPNTGGDVTVNVDNTTP